MNQESAKLFAKWLSKDQPQLFVKLVQAAAKSQVQQMGGLGDFTDVLSSIASNIGTAVNNVGQFLSSGQGLTTLSSLGTAYLNTQAAKTAVNLQVQRAQAGLAPAPIATQYNPVTQSYEPVLVQPTGQTMQLTPSVQQQLLRTNYLPWIIGGIGVLALLFILRR